jgi:NADH-quinone oxidoreductase subunit M
MVAQFKLLDPAHHYSFDYFDLMKIGFPRGTELMLFLAFALAFAVKVPMFPLHTWLPDAHTEAPTGGSIILAAVLLKLGTYGFLRFAFPLFPAASHMIGPTIAGVACTGILYGAAVAWRQRDFKKLIAYSSVSHLGFVMLGIAARTPHSITGAVLQMVNHGISTGALFLLVGVIYDRRHTRDLAEFGGIAQVMPKYAAMFVIVTMSSVGLPLTNGFIGEFLVITGTFSSELLHVSYHCTASDGGQRICDVAGIGPIFSLIAALGVLFGAIYMLECVQRVFFGPLQNPKNKKLRDMNEREMIALVPLVILIFVIGIKPEWFTSRIEPDVTDWIAQYEQKRAEVTSHAGVSESFMLRGEPTAPAGPGAPGAHPGAVPGGADQPRVLPLQPGQPVRPPGLPQGLRPPGQTLAPTRDRSQTRVAMLDVQPSVEIAR